MTIQWLTAICRLRISLFHAKLIVNYDVLTTEVLQTAINLHIVAWNSGSTLLSAWLITIFEFSLAQIVVSIAIEVNWFASFDLAGFVNDLLLGAVRSINTNATRVLVETIFILTASHSVEILIATKGISTLLANHRALFVCTRIRCNQAGWTIHCKRFYGAFLISLMKLTFRILKYAIRYWNAGALIQT